MEPPLILAVAAGPVLALVLPAITLRPNASVERLRLLAEQAVAGERSWTEATRARLAAA